MSVSHLDTAPLQLGERRQLFAMRTLRDGVTSEYGLIILNAGLLHNVGPFRLHVDLAERIAEMGIPVLRLDQSGKGESPKREGLSPIESLLEDYDDACEALANSGAEKFFVAGLCSGADDAMLIAANRKNIHGLILFDGYAKKNWRSRFTSAFKALHHTINRIANWRPKKTLLSSAQPGPPMAINIRAWSSDQDMLSVLTSTLANERGILAVFTSGQDYYEYEGQLHDNLSTAKGLEHLEEIFFAESDHTFSRIFYRRQLVDTVFKWVQNRRRDADSETIEELTTH